MPLERPSVRRLFTRVDADASGTLEASEISAFLQAGGLESGFIASQAADRMVAKLGGADGRITWDQFLSGTHAMLPPGLADAEGRLDRTRVETVYAAMAGDAEKIGADEVAKYVKPQIGGMAAFFAKDIAKVAGCLTVDALDTDGDKAFGKQDLYDLVDDWQREMDAKKLYSVESTQ